METKQCPYCGKTVLSLSRVCKYCRQSFDQPPQNEGVQPAPPTPNHSIAAPQSPASQQNPVRPQSHASQQSSASQQSPASQQNPAITTASPQNMYARQQNVAPPATPYPNAGSEGYDDPGMMPPKPNNYLVFAIIATIFCCIPLGIVSIIYASQVNSAYSAGNYDAAKRSSDKARIWMIWTIVAGFVGFVIAMIAGIFA